MRAAQARQAAAEPASDRVVLVLGAALAAAAVAVYASALDAAFVFDDVGTIVDNEGIRTFPPGPGAEGPLGGLKHRLALQWTFALNYAAGGLDPWGYRAVNVGIHAAAGLFLFGLVRRTLLRPSGGGYEPARARWLAFASALVWLVHPLQTGAVTYVTQRGESLAGACTLAVLYGLVRAAGSARPAGWYALAVVANAIGMATKQTMLVAPALALLYDRVFLSPSLAALLRARWPLYAGLVPPFLWLAATIPGTVGDTRSMGSYAGTGPTRVEYLATQPGVIVHYLRLAAWPAVLCLDYAWPVARGAAAILLPGAAVATALAASLLALRRHPAPAFLGLAFFLLLAPSSSLVPFADLAFEHRMYLALAPVVVAAVLGLDALGRRLLPAAAWRPALAVIALAVAAPALAARTVARNADYADRVTLWGATAACAPHSSRAHHNYGLYLLTDRDDAERGLAELRTAVALEPRYRLPRVVLAKVLRDRGELDEAIAHLRAVIDVNPGDLPAHVALAETLAERGDAAGAADVYERALAMAPRDVELLNAYGVLRIGLDDYTGAAALFRRAVQVSPQFGLGHTHLGLALELANDPAGAIVAHRAALGPAPDSATSLKALARLLATAEPASLRNPTEAVALAERLIATTPEPSAEVLVIVGDAYAAAGRPADAIRAGERAAAAAAREGDADTEAEVRARLQTWRGRLASQGSAPPGALGR